MSPWLGLLEGHISIAKSGVPAKQTRVCARITDSSGINTFGNVISADSRNLAKFMYSWHSNQSDVSKRSSAYKVTDQTYDTLVKIAGSEWIKITLSRFSSVSTIDVCTNETLALLDVRVLDYNDPTDKGNKGAQCQINKKSYFPINSVKSSRSTFVKGGMTCQTYSCTGTRVESFLGQFVTVKSLEESSASLYIAEVNVNGIEIDCPYTGYSDDEGNFEIEIVDLSGQTPKKSSSWCISI
jgi:hypothetical protein